jgi:hypothetical protein
MSQPSSKNVEREKRLNRKTALMFAMFIERFPYGGCSEREEETLKIHCRRLQKMIPKDIEPKNVGIMIRPLALHATVFRRLS